MGAFSTYEACTSLGQAPLPSFKASSNPTYVLSLGLGALHGAVGAQRAGAGPQQQSLATPSSQPLTLPDGRLNVGTHLPLLAGRYRYLARVGEGVSSQALLVEDTFLPGRALVVKAMSRHHAYAGQQEARVLRYLHSAAPSGIAPGVVQLLDTFSLGAHCCLVTERLYPRLLDWIFESSQLPPQEALSGLRKLAHQLLVSVCFLHQLGVVHADLKPDNLLFCSPRGSPGAGVRLVDFGASFSSTDTDTQRVVCEVQTLQYRAPEAVLGLPFGAPIDLWSVGVLLAEAALRQPLLPYQTRADILRMMPKIMGPLPPAMLAHSSLAQQLGLCSSAAPGARLGSAHGNRVPPAGGSAAATSAAASGTAAGAGAVEGRRGSTLFRQLAKMDGQLADLVMGMLRYDPERRLTAAQALLHPFFDPLVPLRMLLPCLQVSAMPFSSPSRKQSMAQPPQQQLQPPQDQPPHRQEQEGALPILQPIPLKPPGPYQQLQDPAGARPTATAAVVPLPPPVRQQQQGLGQMRSWAVQLHSGQQGGQQQQGQQHRHPPVLPGIGVQACGSASNSNAQLPQQPQLLASPPWTTAADLLSPRSPMQPACPGGESAQMRPQVAVGGVNVQAAAPAGGAAAVSDSSAGLAVLHQCQLAQGQGKGRVGSLGAGGIYLGAYTYSSPPWGSAIAPPSAPRCDATAGPAASGDDVPATAPGSMDQRQEQQQGQQQRQEKAEGSGAVAVDPLPASPAAVAMVQRPADTSTGPHPGSAQGSRKRKQPEPQHLQLSPAHDVAPPAAAAKGQCKALDAPSPHQARPSVAEAAGAKQGSDGSGKAAGCEVLPPHLQQAQGWQQLEGGKVEQRQHPEPLPSQEQQQQGAAAHDGGAAHPPSAKTPRHRPLAASAGGSGSSKVRRRSSRVGPSTALGFLGDRPPGASPAAEAAGVLGGAGGGTVAGGGDTNLSPANTEPAEPPSKHRRQGGGGIPLQPDPSPASHPPSRPVGSGQPRVGSAASAKQQGIPGKAEQAQHEAPQQTQQERQQQSRKASGALAGPAGTPLALGSAMREELDASAAAIAPAPSAKRASKRQPLAAKCGGGCATRPALKQQGSSASAADGSLTAEAQPAAAAQQPEAVQGGGKRAQEEGAFAVEAAAGISAPGDGPLFQGGAVSEVCALYGARRMGRKRSGQPTKPWWMC